MFMPFLSKMGGLGAGPRGIIPGMARGAAAGLFGGIVSSVAEGDQSQLGGMFVGAALGGALGGRFGRGLIAKGQRSNFLRKSAFFGGTGTRRRLTGSGIAELALTTTGLIGATVLSSNQPV